MEHGVGFCGGHPNWQDYTNGGEQGRQGYSELQTSQR